MHSNFWYNSLSSICTSLYLIEGTIVFQCASSSKANIWFRSPTMLLHPWDPGPSRSMPQGRGQHLRDGPRRPPLWSPPYETSKGAPAKVEAQTDSTSFQFRTPGTARTKTDAQVAYGVGFVCTLYGWKGRFIELLMAPVSP